MQPHNTYIAHVTTTARVPVFDIGRRRRGWLLSVDGRDVIKADHVSTCHGFGAPYPKPFSAVFVHDARLWLQVGMSRWDVADIIEVRQDYERVRKARYTLTFGDGTRQSVTVRFPVSVVLFRILDPTYDEIESWSEDIMKMLPYTAPDGWRADPTQTIADWSAHVLPMWRTGIRRNGTQSAG